MASQHRTHRRLCDPDLVVLYLPQIGQDDDSWMEDVESFNEAGEPAVAPRDGDEGKGCTLCGWLCETPIYGHD